MHRYTELTALPIGWFLDRVPLSRRKYRRWVGRYGKANEHNALVPRDHWIEPDERRRIIDFAQAYPLEGYRRLTFMMLDRDLVAVSPSTTYRVLKEAGLLRPWNQKPSRKGQGLSSRSSRTSTGTPTSPT